jgi:tetratricopeptide (TPR) repeat protein
MQSDLVQHAELETELAAVQSLLDAEQFNFGLAAAQQLLERLPAEPDESQRDLLYRLLMARVAALTKLDRFDQVLLDCSGMLDLVSLDQSSVRRAGVMIQLSFAQANLLMPEQALRAAHVALQDGLQLQDGLITAQALERLAMVYLLMGDGESAMKFMFEALGQMNQHSSGYERIRRYSNAMHLICTLFDAYVDAEKFVEANAIRDRAADFNEQASALAPQVASQYIVCMWRANQARWHRRCGRRQMARGAFLDLKQRAAAAGWHAVRRPVQLELALMAEGECLPQDAIALLQALFEPADLRVRDVVALPALRALERLYSETNQHERAAAARQDLGLRQAMRRQAVQQAQAQTAGLSERILATLAEADRKRLDEVIRRLRDQRSQGRGLRLRDQDWQE